MFYERLQKLCREKGKKLTPLLAELGMSSGTTGNWQKGALPNGDTLLKLSQYFDVSVDWLLTGEHNKNNLVQVAGSISGRSVMQGHNSSITMCGGKERELSAEELELLRVYGELDLKGRTNLLKTAFDLEENKK